MANRVCFLIDGFNVYHSIVAAMRQDRAASLKWLDLLALCRSYLPAIGKDASLERVFYFSALADWDDAKVARHQQYIRVLRSAGVAIQLGRFKKKTARCPMGHEFQRREEKETDVAIAVKLLELFVLDACDAAVLISGDTDVAPAIRTAKILWPSKKVWVGFPFERHNAELKQLADGHFNIKPAAFNRHQLPNPVRVTEADGDNLVWKPAGW